LWLPAWNETAAKSTDLTTARASASHPTKFDKSTMFWEPAAVQGLQRAFCKTEKVTTCERARKTSQQARSYGTAAPQICVFAPKIPLIPKIMGGYVPGSQ